MAKRGVIVGTVVLAVAMMLVFPVRAAPTEEIDQQQISLDGWIGSSSPEAWYSQGFVPSYDILTKVKLNVYIYIYKEPAGDFAVSIRKDLPSFNDLTSISMLASDLPHGYHGEWMEFDFPDISVTAGSQYYIVISHTQECPIMIGVQHDTNPYPDGELGVSDDFGQSWYYHTDDDLAFETYGYDEDIEYILWIYLVIIFVVIINIAVLVVLIARRRK